MLDDREADLDVGGSEEDVDDEVFHVGQGVEHVEEVRAEFQTRHQQLKGLSCYGRILRWRRRNLTHARACISSIHFVGEGDRKPP